MHWFWQKITLTYKQKIELEQISSSRTHRADYIERAKIILACAQTKSNAKIAEELHIHARTVKKWRDRWRANEDKLALIDIEEKGINYTRKLLEILRDEVRIGAPCKFTAEQICQIMIVASERPEDIGLPISHWSITSLRDELIKRGIVDDISCSHLAVFLNQAEIKPHKIKEWLHTPIENEEEYNRQVTTVCQLYNDAPKLHEEGVHVLSCDEKTGIQALERKITPMKPGQIERQDSSYERHGTQCLIGNFEVATGRIIFPTIGDTRTEQDFAAHIEQTINTDSDGEWIFIMDNLNTHQSETLVCSIARRLGITDDLGVKGESGILKSMETRAKFLSDELHRIRIVYTPKHASWLNQIEIWFGTLSKRLLKRLSAISTEELKCKIMEFIDYFNETMAKVYKWTYNGRPLTA